MATANCTLNGWRCRIKQNWYKEGSSTLGKSVDDSDGWKTDFTSDFGSLNPNISSTHHSNGSKTGNMYTVCIKFTTPNKPNIKQIEIPFYVFNQNDKTSSTHSGNKLFACLRTTSTSSASDNSSSWSNTISDEWSTDVSTSSSSTKPVQVTATFTGSFAASTAYYMFLYTKDNGTNGPAIYGMYDISSSKQRVGTPVATYTNPTYTISYNANGGTGAPSSQTKNHDKTLTLSTTKPTKAQTSNTVTGSFKITGNANGGYFGSNTSTTTTTITATTSRTDKTTYTFSKWNTKSDGTGTSYDSGGSYTANAKATLYAQYTSSTSTGTTSYTNNAISGLTTPSRAKATQATYTVTFNANGGSCSTTSLQSKKTRSYSFKGWAESSTATTALANTKKYTSAKTVYAVWGTTDTTEAMTLPTATRSGYTFKGWSTSKSATTGTTGSYTPTATVTLYAVWENNTFTLTLNKGTGISAVTGAGSKTGGASVTIGATVSAGYTWKNWTSGTSTTQVSDKQSYTFNMPKENTTYKANATANKYTVTFNANGGNTPSPATKSVTYASTYGDLATCTRTGYDFAGWYTAASGGTQITSTTTVSITSAQTLYAHWTVKSYTLTLNKGTGINSVSGAGSKNYGSTVTISATVLPGYTWKNWTTGTSTTVFTTDQTHDFVMPASAKTYKANATANTYYVKYNANGGSGSMSNSTHTYNTESKLSPNAFTRPGYKFIGWSTSSTATSATYTDQQGVKTLTTTSKGTVNLYAIWQPTSEMYIAVKQADGTLKFQRALKYVYKTS